MVRTPVKMDVKSIRGREYHRRYRMNKGRERIKDEHERRDGEKHYSFSLYEVDRLHLTYAGQETIIGRLKDEQFRSWFCGVVDAALPHIKNADACLILSRARLECMRWDEIDDCVRYDLINTLYELPAFRQSGVAFVAEAKMARRPQPTRAQPAGLCLCGCGQAIEAKKGGRVREFASPTCQSRYYRSKQEKTAAHKAPKTHCPHGHPYSEENTYIDKLGHKNCRTCQRLRKHQSRQQGKENREEQSA